MKKKLMIISEIIVLILVSSTTVLASNLNSNNTMTIMNIQKEILDKEFVELTTLLLTGTENEFETKVNEFNDRGYIVYAKANELKTLKSHIQERLQLSSTASLSNYQIYYSEANNNSTKDTTIIVDTKINCGNYNLLVMVEYHINNEGAIYGFNVWAV